MICFSNEAPLICFFFHTDIYLSLCISQVFRYLFILNIILLIGTLVQITQKCKSCTYCRTWNSQPMLGNTPAGNVLLSGAIMFAGATATKILRVMNHMKLATISLRTFLTHQREYLQPVVQHVWACHQTRAVEELQVKGRPLIIGGDRRADTPGYSAKYGAYTVMNLEDN